MPAPFVWFDHRSDDPAAALTFYEKLLGWKPAPQSPPGLTVLAPVPGDERAWGGMAESEQVPAGWLPYVQVEDVDAAGSQAESLGGRIVKTRTRGPAGDFVVVEDPGGARLALWTPA